MGPLWFLLWLFLVVLFYCFRIVPSPLSDTALAFCLLRVYEISFLFGTLRIMSLQEPALSNLLLPSFHMCLPPSQQSPGLKITHTAFKVPISL